MSTGHRARRAGRLEKMLPRLALPLTLSFSLCLTWLPYADARAATGASATVAERLAAYGPWARERLAPRFAAAGIPYPPARVVLVGLKQERELQVYAGPSEATLRHVVSYPVLAASGSLGPKLAVGDRQVPEGLYRIDALNPNSRFHLSLRVSYPNAFDRARAREESRSRLGGDIMIHGAATSLGCLAMSDTVAEDLFVLVAESGRENVRVVLSPVDFRRTRLPETFRPARPWVPELHEAIRVELMRLPVPGETASKGGADGKRASIRPGASDAPIRLEADS